MLRKNAKAGAYDRIGTSFALAERLSNDLQQVSPDGHLKVVPIAPPPRGAGPQQIFIPRPGVANAQAPTMPVENAPVEQPRWLATGVAFVRLNHFPGTPEVIAAVDRFMSSHATASTLIIDLRTHRGGGLLEMDAILPYLFKRPTTLLAMEARASVDRERPGFTNGERVRIVPSSNREIVRREHHVTPHPSETRLFDAKVYVLTSNFTGSAAEHLALALKRTRRATLIGETTGGAGNYSAMFPLAGKFTAVIPISQTLDPDTGRGWEGTGVTPDVQVPAERALTETLTRIGLPPAEASRLSAEVHPTAPMHRLK
jgi:C-terminal processing protease CtpA/Prc